LLRADSTPMVLNSIEKKNLRTRCNTVVQHPHSLKWPLGNKQFGFGLTEREKKTTRNSCFLRRLISVRSKLGGARKNSIEPRVTLLSGRGARHAAVTIPNGPALCRSHWVHIPDRSRRSAAPCKQTHTHILWNTHTHTQICARHECVHTLSHTDACDLGDWYELINNVSYIIRVLMSCFSATLLLLLISIRCPLMCSVKVRHHLLADEAGGSVRSLMALIGLIETKWRRNEET